MFLTRAARPCTIILWTISGTPPAPIPLLLEEGGPTQFFHVFPQTKRKANRVIHLSVGKHLPHVEKNVEDNCLQNKDLIGALQLRVFVWTWLRASFQLIRPPLPGRSPPRAWCDSCVQGRKWSVPHSNTETETVHSCSCWPGPHRSRPSPWWHTRWSDYLWQRWWCRPCMPLPFSNSPLALWQWVARHTPGLALMAWKKRFEVNDVQERCQRAPLPDTRPDGKRSRGLLVDNHSLCPLCPSDRFLPSAGEGSGMLILSSTLSKHTWLTRSNAFSWSRLWRHKGDLCSP